jgi:anti-sigma regulatory factor (Ser/Thr protein kinase)
MTFTYSIHHDDILDAGQASRELKRALASLGVPSEAIRRTAVAMYEGEMNMVIHAGGGEARAEVEPGSIVLTLEDKGPGIPDVEKAMTEGWSTAPEWVRKMGFGAGMGLPNMKRCADSLSIETAPGKGTKVVMELKF